MRRRKLLCDHDRRHIGERKRDPNHQLEERCHKRVGGEGPRDEDHDVNRASDREQDVLACEPAQHVGVTHGRDLGQGLERGGSTDEERPAAEDVDLHGKEVLGRRQRGAKQEQTEQKAHHGERKPGVHRSGVGDRIAGHRCRFDGLDEAPHPESDDCGERRVDEWEEAKAEGLEGSP